ncbi:MAG: efflux RND transporter periplasmic adaptor subunit [Methylophilaceae bacterium]
MPGFAGAAEIIKISPAQQKTLHLELAAIQPANATISQRLPGEIVVPVGQSRVISAPQAGLIDEVMVATGQSVRKGQVLAHLSSPDLVALQRDHLQALSQQRLSQNSLNRDAELYKDGIIAERRYLTSKSTHAEVSAQLAERRQALKLSGMSNQAISKLESSGSYAGGMSLVAPIDGVVLEQLVTTGQRIDPSMPIYRIAKLDPLWLEIRVPAQALSGLVNGMQVAIANSKATGKIIAIVRNINKLDQTALVRVAITSGTDTISPGQLVEAEILRTTTETSFSVPKSAVFQKSTGKDSNESYVFIQVAGGFEPRKIVMVSSESSQAVIRGDFKGSERVVSAGIAALKAKWLGIGSE